MGGLGIWKNPLDLAVGPTFSDISFHIFLNLHLNLHQILIDLKGTVLLALAKGCVPPLYDHISLRTEHIEQYQYAEFRSEITPTLLPAVSMSASGFIAFFVTPAGREAFYCRTCLKAQMLQSFIATMSDSGRRSHQV